MVVGVTTQICLRLTVQNVHIALFDGFNISEALRDR